MSKETTESEVKVIKVTLNYADENGKHSTKEFSIKLNTLTQKDKSALNYGRAPKYTYTLQFTLRLPDHIHSYLLGKTVPVSGISRKSEIKNYPLDYAKTIKAPSIEGLTEAWYEIIADYIWLKQIESAELTKVIFYTFDTGYGATKSHWNGIHFGVEYRVGFDYCFGYISGGGNKMVRYNKDKKMVSASRDEGFMDMEYVVWTEERQQFFDSIQNSFATLIGKIDTFKDSLSEDTINAIISNKTLLLGS